MFLNILDNWTQAWRETAENITCCKFSLSLIALLSFHVNWTVLKHISRLKYSTLWWKLVLFSSSAFQTLGVFIYFISKVSLRQWSFSEFCSLETKTEHLFKTQAQVWVRWGLTAFSCEHIAFPLSHSFTSRKHTPVTNVEPTGPWYCWEEIRELALEKTGLFQEQNTMQIHLKYSWPTLGSCTQSTGKKIAITLLYQMKY